MKTINGNNKLERQITKAQKYLNIELVDSSNKYLEIKNYDQETTFIFFGKPKMVKNGELMVLETLNGKPIFLKSWAGLVENNYFGEFVIFKSWSGNHAELLELAKGCDDVWLLKDYQNDLISKDMSSKIRIAKN